MIHRSPLPDVDIPAVPLPGYVLAPRGRPRGQARADRRPHRAHPDLRPARPGRPGTRRRPGGARVRSRRRAGPDGAEPAGVRRGLPRGGLRGRHHHHGQPDVHRARGAPPAARRRRAAAGHRTPVPRDGDEGRGRHRDRDGARARRRPRHPAAGGRPPFHRAAGRATGRAGARGPRRRRRAPVLLGDHRHVERRDAHAPQSGGQRRAGTRARRYARGREGHRRAAVLPHLRHAGTDEHRPARGRHHHHDAPVRPRAVPAHARGVRHHALVRRTAHRRGAGEAPAGRRVRSVRSSSRSSPAPPRSRPSWHSRRARG